MTVIALRRRLLVKTPDTHPNDIFKSFTVLMETSWTVSNYMQGSCSYTHWVWLYSTMPPKKFREPNSKAVVARERKAAAKREEEERRKREEEDEYWRDDDKHVMRKQDRKVSELSHVIIT